MVVPQFAHSVADTESTFLADKGGGGEVLFEVSCLIGVSVSIMVNKIYKKEKKSDNKQDPWLMRKKTFFFIE